MPEVHSYESSNSRTSLPYHSLLNPKTENDEEPYLRDGDAAALRRKFVYGVIVGLLSGLSIILIIYATFSYISNWSVPHTFPPDCRLGTTVFSCKDCGGFRNHVLILSSSITPSHV